MAKRFAGKYIAEKGGTAINSVYGAQKERLVTVATVHQSTPKNILAADERKVAGIDRHGIGNEPKNGG